MSRYYQETWNGLGTLGAADCHWMDAMCHAKKAADAAGGALDKATGGGWSKTKAAREAAAEMIGIKEPNTSINRPGTPKPGGGAALPPVAEEEVVVTEETTGISMPMILGGVAILGLVGYLVMQKKKK